MSKSAEFVSQAFGDAQKGKLVGPPDLVIWGGRFPDSQADAFLDNWDKPLRTVMTWRMIEYVSQFNLYRADAQDAALPQPWFNVERARFFGQANGIGGDLDLRRDGQEFRWRFIGAASDAWPTLPAAFPYHDFWTEPDNQNTRFREVAQRYYQWQGRPREQRVGSREWLRKAELAQENVYLVQKQYLENGRVAFVRYVEYANGR